jgi:hypothetical protein
MYVEALAMTCMSVKVPRLAEGGKLNVVAGSSNLPPPGPTIPVELIE